jgi:diguanylate cyclase (GGDEF)-like protein/PAS domain S-box-containing protein
MGLLAPFPPGPSPLSPWRGSCHTLLMALLPPRHAGPIIALSTDFIRAKEYFEAIIASSGDLICTTDVRGRIVYFSPGAESMLGMSMAQAVGRPAHDLYTGGRQDAERIMRLLRESPHGRVSNLELQMKRADGKTLHGSLSVSYLKDGRGRVVGTLGIGKDITDRVRLEERLRELSRTDDLTGLYNQRHLHDRLREEAARAQRQKQPLSLVLFDLDGFKQVNDRLGHIEGDRLLRAFAAALGDNIRKEVDSAFRYGGDEFVILLPDTPAVKADRAARRIAKAAAVMLAPKGVTASWGVASLPKSGDVSALVKEADAAMYGMKSGRENVRMRGTALARAFAPVPAPKR